jgi:outer membrane protein insertion porin family/translocation and assembly module TamA
MTRLGEPRRSRVDALITLAFVAAIAVIGGCKTIPEGKSAVNEVQVRGADKVDGDDVIDKIATTETPKFLGLFRGILFEYALFDRFVLQRDLARVEAFYRSKGYYDVHARAGLVHQLDD